MDDARSELYFNTTMRIIFKYIAETATFLAATLVAGCKDDSDPPVPEGPDTEFTPNTTIAELKEAYWNDASNHILTIGINGADEHVVVSGRVISSDTTRNITQCIVIQDATGALAIRINADSLFTNYKIGQAMTIDATDMHIGRYQGLQQLGSPDQASGRGRYPAPMPPDFFTLNSRIDGSPDPTDIDTIPVAIPALISSPEVLRRMQSRLVRIDNVRFSAGGRAAFCATDKSTTDRLLLDSANNSLAVRTSGKATFAGETLPEGQFDIVGILSYDDTGTGAAWYLLLRSTEDLLNVRTPDPAVPDNPDDPDAPDTPAITAPRDTLTEVVADFTGITSIDRLQGWRTVTASGNKSWNAQTLSGNTFAFCTGYNGKPDASGFDAWLITPALDADHMRHKNFSFTSGAGYIGDGILEVYVMDNDDPATATLTRLSPDIPQPTGSWTEFIPSGNLDLSPLSGIIYIGFRYTAPASAPGYVTYRIDDIRIGTDDNSPGTGGDNPAIPDLPGGDGTQANPYNVAQALEIYRKGGASDLYVAGYIVGFIDDSDANTGAHFSADHPSVFNILIASSPSETDAAGCLAVQLPWGAVRSALNLASNPANLGRLVTLRGDIGKYLGTAGLRSTSSYSFAPLPD